MVGMIDDVLFHWTYLVHARRQNPCGFFNTIYIFERVNLKFSPWFFLYIIMTAISSLSSTIYNE